MAAGVVHSDIYGKPSLAAFLLAAVATAYHTHDHTDHREAYVGHVCDEADREEHRPIGLYRVSVIEYARIVHRHGVIERLHQERAEHQDDNEDDTARDGPANPVGHKLEFHSLD